jgi:hypothetical protein
VFQLVVDASGEIVFERARIDPAAFVAAEASGSSTRASRRGSGVAGMGCGRRVTRTP